MRHPMTRLKSLLRRLRDILRPSRRSGVSMGQLDGLTMEQVAERLNPRPTELRND
jgi:hypothetical protein